MTLDRRVVPFKRHHYEWLSALSHRAEGGLNLPISASVFDQLEAENSWTGVVDGEPVVCAGTMMQWPGRHTAWAYVAKGTLPLLPWITQHVRAAVERVKGRIEFTVRSDFPAGQRWARSLGFQVETPLLRAFGPEGEDHVGYVRFN